MRTNKERQGQLLLPIVLFMSESVAIEIVYSDIFHIKFLFSHLRLHVFEESIDKIDYKTPFQLQLRF